VTHSYGVVSSEGITLLALGGVRQRHLHESPLSLWSPPDLTSVCLCQSLCDTSVSAPFAPARPPFIPPHALLCRWWLILAVAILVVLILLLCCIWCCCDGECGSGRPSKEDRVSVHSTPEKASPPRGAVQGTPLRADGEGKVVRLKGGSPPLRSGAQPLLDASEGTTGVHARSAYLPLMYLATRLFLMCSGCPELEVGWGRVGELI
jgi:hypothetical protein